MPTMKLLVLHGVNLNMFGQRDPAQYGTATLADIDAGLRNLAQELDRWVFVGDSGNDQAMFQHFTHSVGVANIARFVPQLSHLPRYVTQGERGAGFAEVARAILAGR